MDASYSEYLLPLTNVAELFGRSGSVGTRLTRMIHRDQLSTTEVTGELRHRRSERFINGAPLTPQNLTTFRLSGRHIRQFDDSRWSFDGGITFGLRGLNATVDKAGIDGGFPHAQYWKLDGGILRSAPASDWGMMQSDLRLQYAPYALYPAEQMTLGSEATVRGYEGTEAVGDLGLYLRNDLLLASGVLDTFWSEGQRPGWTDNLRLSGFLDLGAVYDHGRKDWQKAAGMGIGIGYSAKRASASLTIAAPLIEDSNFGLGKPVVQFSVVAKAF